MATFRPGERVRTTRAIGDIAPGIEMPEKHRDMPVLGTIVGISEREAPPARGEFQHWIVRIDEIDQEVAIDETSLMSMDAPLNR